MFSISAFNETWCFWYVLDVLCEYWIEPAQVGAMSVSFLLTWALRGSFWQLRQAHPCLGVQLEPPQNLNPNICVPQPGIEQKYSSSWLGLWCHVSTLPSMLTRISSENIWKNSHPYYYVLSLNIHHDLQDLSSQCSKNIPGSFVCSVKDNKQDTGKLSAWNVHPFVDLLMLQNESMHPISTRITIQKHVNCCQ